MPSLLACKELLLLVAISVLDVTIGMHAMTDDGMAPWIDLAVVDANMTEPERLIGTLVEGRLEMDSEIQVRGS